jgi:hypothetical protein
MLADQFVYFTIEPPNYIEQDELTIVYPENWPSGEANVIYLDSSQATRLQYSFPSGKTYISPDQFEWESSDDEIAEILPDGTILPHSEGMVRFTLTAKNNGKHPVQVHTDPILIKSGGDPSVVVPDFANRVYAMFSQPAVIVWSTNVMSKYRELAAGDTPKDAEFTVELYEGYWNASELDSNTPLETWSPPDHPELVNAMSFTIPGGLLTNISNLQTPSYTVKISTAHPTQPAATLSALAYIVVNSPPVVITLDKSMGSIVTDDIGYINLTWTMKNFDMTNYGDFEFKVTKNGAPVPGGHITFDKSTGTFDNANVNENGGSYRLDIAPVSGNQLKDLYTITLAAKNHLDSSWSYDSHYLQVYKTGAFRILVDGQPKTTHTMSNVQTIRDMQHEQRLALQRQITLKNDISINAGDYADISQIADQFIWKSSNNDVGALNFTSGGRTANIETFSYSSYQPKHHFMLSGIEDGQTKITATHAATGMKAELDVTVETLRD